MKSEVKSVFVDELGLDPDNFTDDLRYGQIPEWDSTSHMVVVMALEEKFGIEFESDEIVNLTTVSAIYDALAARGLAAG